MSRRPVQIVFDAVDAAALGGSWASALEEPSGTQPRLFFHRVPEAEGAENRVHLDLQAGGGHGVPLAGQQERVATEVARLEALGATRQQAHTELGARRVVMHDPEGDEFCV